MQKVVITGLTLSSLVLAATSWAWDPAEADEYHAKAQVAIAAFMDVDVSTESYFDEAAGYVVIPTVGKAGFGIGGARGKGVLYENDAVTAVVTLTQLSFGFQWGGQAYSEFIFFKDEGALADFKRGNYELGVQASAVAVSAGASANANYSSGVAIFTQAKGGLMYEATVGGQ